MLFVNSATFLGCSVCLAAIGAPGPGTVPQSQLVLEQAVLTRALGIEAPNNLTGLLETMPAGSIARDNDSKKLRVALWSLFFSGSMTKLARVLSPQPFFVFYNPIADVALIQGCRVDPESRKMLCGQACAVPGEVLSSEAVGARPRWLISSDPVGTLEKLAESRMRTFAAANPANSPEVAFWRRTYCSPDNQSTSEKRIVALVQSAARFDQKHFVTAAGQYVIGALKASAQAQTAGKPKAKADDVVTVLEHLNELVLAGAIERANGGWIIFMSEKTNGWRAVAISAIAGPDGALTLDGARLLNISTRAK